MPQYLIYFHQQWVGDHSEEWFRERGELSRVVVDDIRAAGDFVCAGGLLDRSTAFCADATSGSIVFTDGPVSDSDEWLGGMTVVDVADEATARTWAGRIAEACGWPQEVRQLF